MPCMLRIGGKRFNVNMLEDSHVAEAYKVWKKGTRLTKSKKNLHSGISFLASDAGFDNFDDQKSEVIQFLKAKKDTIREIMKLPDLDFARLDFGIEFRVNDDIYVKSFFFSAEMVKLAGDLGLELELSLYPPSEESD